jgi:hypothetical protein
MQKNAYYSILFRLERPLHAAELGDEYIQEIKGDIILRRYATDTGETVGTLTAFTVDGERAMIRHEDLFEVVDSCNRTLTTCFEWLFNMNKGRWRKPIRQRWGKELSANCLYIDTVALEPAHRGRDVGLLAVCRVLDRFAPPNGLAILEPGPMQFGPHGADRPGANGSGPTCCQVMRPRHAMPWPNTGAPSASPTSATPRTGLSWAASASLSLRTSTPASATRFLL